MDKNKIKIEDTSTIVSPITNVIVKATPVNFQDVRNQRPDGETVLVISTKPQRAEATSQASAVIVKNHKSSFISVHDFAACQSFGVIRSTKSEEYQPVYLIETKSKPPQQPHDVKQEPLKTEIEAILLSPQSTSSSSSSSTITTVNQCVPDSIPEDCSSPSTSTRKENNPRDARNKAEKHRRDKLNSSISELATLVPLVAGSSKKIDKTGILRLTAHDLRKDHIFGDSISKPSHMDPPANAAEAVVDMLGGFFLTVTCKGIIVIVTSNIEQHLGHYQIDLLGKNIFGITHPEDVKIMKQELMPRNIPLGPNGQLILQPKLCNQTDKLLRDERRDFQVRLARSVQHSEEVKYELCRIDGVLRLADRAGTHAACVNMRRHRNKTEDTLSPSGNDVVFLGMVRIIKTPFLSERLIEASKLEYRTRHLVDGRIVQCDQRISIVAGYMTSEIAGVSAFTFIHKEDVRWVIIALRQMYDRNNKCGESCYRLIARNGEFIHLRTRGYLEVNSENNAVESFVCINTLVSEMEGKALITEMKKRYSVLVDAELDMLTTSSGEPSLEDPKQLEQAIMHLITNLPSPGNHLARSPSPTPMTPPPLSLSIIAPKKSTIKTTIAKSVSVINKAIRMKSLEKDEELAYSITDVELPRDTVVKNKTNANKVQNSDNNSNITRPVAKPSVAFAAESDTAPIVSPSVPNNNSYENASSFRQPFPPKESQSPSSQNSMSLPTISDALNLRNEDIVNGDLFNLNNFSNDMNGDSLLDVDTSDSIFLNSSDENFITNGDSLINSLHALGGDDSFDAGPSTSFVNPLSVLKRSCVTAIDAPSSSKRKPNCVDDNNVDLNNVLYDDGMMPPLLSDPAKEENNDGNIYPLDDIDIQQQGFDNYIDQLTDPNSDLSDVVPRSLAALETSINQIDDDVHSMNDQNDHFEQEQQQNLADIIMEHEEQKQILESIQQDYKNQTTDRNPPSHDINT